MSFFVFVLIAYSLLLVALGLYLSRRVRVASDFFVAGRSLGPGLLFSTMLAANIGAGSTVGAASLGYRFGLSGWWWVGSAGIGSLVLAFTVGPKIYRLAREHGFLTVGDFLEYRYDRSVRGVIAGLMWLGTLAILAGQLIAIASVLYAVTGIPKAVGCALGGVIVVLYFAAGGLAGAARINLLQLVVKGFGFSLAVPMALAATDGWLGLQQRILQQPGFDETFFSMTGIGGAGIAGYVILLAPSFIISPGLLQKIYGARDTRAVRMGVAAQGLVLLLFAFFPVLLGMIAAAHFPGLENPDLALPTVMTQLLPFWLGALLLASVFSAELSSADAALFMLSTSMSRDLYQSYVNPEVSSDELLKISRWTAVGSGLLGSALAILLPTVIAALSIFYALMSVSLFVPLVVGLYRSRPSARVVVPAIGAAVAVTTPIYLWTGGKGFGLVSPVAAGILLSLLIVLAWRNR